MFGLCCFIIACLLLRYFGPIKIFIEPKTTYYNGPTNEQFWKDQAKKESQRLTELYPELRYEILRTKYETGQIDKETYEIALKNITDNIEIKV